MCGILACLYAQCVDRTATDMLRQQIVQMSTKLRHRGPDWSGVKVLQSGSLTHVLAHERLTIVGTESGEQPLVDAAETVFLTVNGEIFNHLALRQGFLQGSHQFMTQSDCEVILHGYIELGPKIVEHLDGQFSFVLVDRRLPGQDTFLVARDPIGITPLYYGRDELGRLLFASELKALLDVVPKIMEFPPGHLMVGSQADDSASLQRYFTPPWIDEAYLPAPAPVDFERLRATFTAAVRKRLMSDVPWGVLLSGGLDSSLVASIASRMAARRVEANDTEPSWWSPRLHTFSIGLKESPDLEAARTVASFLGTVHHEFVFSVDEAIDAIKSVIYHLEVCNLISLFLLFLLLFSLTSYSFFFLFFFFFLLSFLFSCLKDL